MPVDLQDILDAYDYDATEWRDIYEEGNTDIRVLSGDVWDALDPEGAKQRRDANRPMIAPDELGQYINQAVNDVRANPRGIKYSPTGGEATEKGAEFYQNKTREIEYRSHAANAYATAFENAIQRSFGYVRVSSKYVHEAIFDPERPPDVTLLNQELWIDAIANPNMVLPGFKERPDLSDMSRCFVLQWQDRKEFQRKFPDASVQNFTPSLVKSATQTANWFSTDLKQILTAEYWSVDQIGTRTLYVLKPGRPTKLDPKPQPRAIYLEKGQRRPNSDQILGHREIPIRRVRQYLANGVEILETNDWQGQYIPITGCFGKMLYVDDGAGATRKILSLTRLARDPFMAYAYLWSCETEVVGSVPKFPYFFVEGQLSPDMLNKLGQSTYVPIVAIAYKANVPGVTPPGEILPPPTRNPYTGDAIQFLELAKEAARRAIQAAMGITPLPTPVQRENQKSGKALEQIESSGQRGSYHFVDSYEGMIRQVGTIIEDLMDQNYDTVRDVGVYQNDDQAAIVRVNDPEDPESVSTKGHYQVTISVGPATDSQRAEASDFVNAMVQNLAALAQIAGPQIALKLFAKSVKLKQLGPIGDQIVDLLDPQQMGQDGKPVPPQVAQLLGENQQLKQILQQAAQEKQAKVIEQQGKMQITQVQEQAETQRNRENNEVKLAVAEISAKVDRLELFLEESQLVGARRHDALEGQRQRTHEMIQNEKDRAHDVATSMLEHDQAQAAAAQDAATQPPDNGAGA